MQYDGRVRYLNSSDPNRGMQLCYEHVDHQPKSPKTLTMNNLVMITIKQMCRVLHMFTPNGVLI